MYSVLTWAIVSAEVWDQYRLFLEGRKKSANGNAISRYGKLKAYFKQSYCLLLISQQFHRFSTDR
jgi:hypothetical protein